MGQNFVTKDDILAAIVRAAGVVAGRTVLEIGPGTGNLTKHLLLAGAHVVAIEKDDALFARLKDEFKQVCCVGFEAKLPCLNLQLPAFGICAVALGASGISATSVVTSGRELDAGARGRPDAQPASTAAVDGQTGITR